MNRQALVNRAKAILAEAYEEATELVALYLEKNPGEQLQSLCKEIDPDNWNALRKRVQRAQAARKIAADADSVRPAPRWIEGRGSRAARQVLRDPDQRRQIIESLEPAEIEEIVSAGTERLVENARARQAEHRTEPTAKDLMGDDPFNPSEHWADTVVIRVSRNARELASLIKRAGGLLYGSMTPEEAYEYLHEAECLIAEARAAAQEQVRDEVQV